MQRSTRPNACRYRGSIALVCLTLVCLTLPAGAQTVQPARPGAPINRMMDIWPGIVFVCVPDAKLRWSFPACEGIEKEARHLAQAGQVRIATAGDPKTPSPNEAARVAGFDGTIALSLVAKFTPNAQAGSSLSLQATSRADANPGVTEPLYRTVYTQSAILRQGATAADAITTGKTMLEGLFETFLKPMKR